MCKKSADSDICIQNNAHENSCSKSVLKYKIKPVNNNNNDNRVLLTKFYNFYT